MNLFHQLRKYIMLLVGVSVLLTLSLRSASADDGRNQPIRRTLAEIVAQSAASIAARGPAAVTATPAIRKTVLHSGLVPSQVQNKQNRLSPAKKSLPVTTPDIAQARIRDYSSLDSLFAPQTVTDVLPPVDMQDSGAVNPVGNLNFVSVPPDTMGTVGPTQFVTHINDMVRIQAKTAPFALTIPDISNFQFYNAVLPGAPPDPLNLDVYPFDVRVRYDRLSGRWFFTGELFNPNEVVIGVSDGPVLVGTTNIQYFFFTPGQSAPVDATRTDCFYDYPTLSIDANAVYIGMNMFDCAAYTASTGFGGSALFVLQKSLLLAPTATPANLDGVAGAVTAFRNLLPNLTPTVDNEAGLYTPQGADDFEGTTTQGYVVGVDISDAGPTISRLVMVRVVNPGSGAPSLSALFGIPLNPIVGVPFPSPHLGSTGLGIDSGDGRLIHAHTRGGILYTSHTVSTDAAGAQSATPDRNSTSWYEISNIDGAPTIAQRGVIHDSSAAATNYIWGSFMTSGQGHAAFGMTAVSATTFASAATIGRLVTDPAGSVQYPPVIYQPGQDQYNLDFGNPGSLRWGDYSYTSLDPCDDMTMWTIQEYAVTPPIDFAGEIGQWGVIAARLLAPPPVITSASPPTILTGQALVTLTLTGTGFYDPTPWPGNTTCLNRLQITITGIPGLTVVRVTYISPTRVEVVLSTTGVSAVGTGTLTLTNPDGQSATIQFGTGNPPPAPGVPAQPTGAVGALPATGYPPVEPDRGPWLALFGGLVLVGLALAGVILRRRRI